MRLRQYDDVRGYISEKTKKYFRRAEYEESRARMEFRQFERQRARRALIMGGSSFHLSLVRP